MLTNIYSEEILSYINSVPNLIDFNSLEDIDKDHLVALAIESLNSDIELILSRRANTILAKYLTSYSPDERIEMMAELKESAREYFADDLDLIIDEIVTERLHESHRENGRRSYLDVSNGEVYFA